MPDRSYAVAHADTDDSRGIDVAFVYDTKFVVPAGETFTVGGGSHGLPRGGDETAGSIGDIALLRVVTATLYRRGWLGDIRRGMGALDLRAEIELLKIKID